MAQQTLLDNQPFITDPDVIAKFVELGIDPTGKTSTQLNDEINTLIAKESAKVVFDPSDPLDYLSAGLTLSGLGAGAGLGLKGLRTASKGKKAKENIGKFQQLKSLLSPIKTKGPTPGPTVTPLSGSGAPFSTLVQPRIPFAVKLPQTATYAGVGVKLMDEAAEEQQLADQAAILQEDINALKVEEIKAANEQIAQALNISEEKPTDPPPKIGDEKIIDGKTYVYTKDGFVLKKETQSPVTSLFATPQFNDFLRNVGQSLVETGQFGPGLAQGAAKAAEERAAKELALQLEIAKGLQKEGITANKLSEIRLLYQDTAGEFQRGANTEKLLFDVLDIVDQANVTGLPALVDQIKFRFGAAINISGKETPVIAAANILEEIARSSPGDFLGQTGRLSDQDIQMAQQLLAAIKGPKGVFKSDDEIEQILRRRLTDIATEQRNRLNRINELDLQIRQAGDIPPVIITDFSGTTEQNQQTSTKTRIPLDPKQEALKEAGVN
jgi:hypothetical protein